MPKQINPESALSEIKLENTFTRAALKAHPETGGLVADLADWDAPIAALQARMEANEVERVELDAEFKILNAAFDKDCQAFAEPALKAAGNNRESPRFTRYFAVAPSKFVKQDIEVQIQAVEGWLTVEDPTLDPWREAFQNHLTRLKAHLQRRRASQQKTIDLTLARQAFANDLTKKRDALHRRLGDLAEARGQGRDFPDLFFRAG